jgi:hypothetical protein
MAEVEVKVDFAPIITELQSLASQNFEKSCGTYAYPIRRQLSTFRIGNRPRGY